MKIQKQVLMNFLRKRTSLIHYAIWIKDCAPETLDEIAGNHEIIESLKTYISTDNLPNLLLTGPNGCGKKNMAELTAKTYLGQYYEKGCIRIDGSIHRGKDMITNTYDYKKASTDKTPCDIPNVMTFARSKLLIGTKKRIVIIYNFDHMTSEAQNAMRRIIELSAKNTRFILICNNIEEIIEAIQSRCVPLRVAPIDDSDMISLLQKILIKNNIAAEAVGIDVLKTICDLSGGDIKKAINYLQVISNSPDPSVETFFKIFNLPPIHNIKKIIMAVQSPTTYQDAYDTLDILLNNGYDATDILGIFISTVAKYEELPLNIRISYLHAISRCYVKTELVPSKSHIFSLIARMGEIAKNGYTAESI